MLLTIGVAGHYLYQQGRFADLALNGHSNIDLETVFGYNNVSY